MLKVSEAFTNDQRLQVEIAEAIIASNEKIVKELREVKKLLKEGGAPVEVNSISKKGK